MKTSTAIKIFLGFILASILLVIVGFNITRGASGNAIPDLNARINFSDTQFLLSNNDPFNWTNVKMTVNDKYDLIVDKINAGESYTVGMAQFADSSGNRFNSITMKPMHFSIRAKEGSAFFDTK
jgi:hypothetical protein